MIPRRLLRPLALVGVLALGAAATGCSSTMNDAATITYKDKSGTHTIHITREAFEKEMRGLAQDAALVSALASNSQTKFLTDFAASNGESTDADLTATWLRILMTQAITDSQFKTGHLQLSEFDTANAQALAAGGMPNEASYLGLPKSLQKTMADRAERVLAVSRSTCNSGKAIGQIVVANKARADAIVAQLKQSTDPNRFVNLVQQQSIDAQSRQANGLVGCFDPNSYGQYGQTLDAAPPGTPVGPIQGSPGAYYVFILRPWAADLPNTQASAQTSVQEERANAEQLLLRANIWIDPRFGTVQRIVGQQGPTLLIVPPAVPYPREQREVSSVTTTTTPQPGG
jgi:hypothetical protein